MNKAKKEKNTKITNNVEDQLEIKKFLIILGTITVLIGSVFVFTRYVINDGDVHLPLLQPIAGQVNYYITSVGSMLEKDADEYYVLIYDNEAPTSAKHANVFNYYAGLEKLPIYVSYLDNLFNEDFKATEDRPENTKAKTVEDFSFGEITLIKVEDGKVVNYYNDFDKIVDVLQ